MESANVLSCQRPRMKKDLRGTHGRQAVPTGQGELVVVVGVGGDFVSALGVLRVGQECVLEPGYELALKPSRSSAPMSHADSDNS